MTRQITIAVLSVFYFANVLLSSVVVDVRSLLAHSWQLTSVTTAKGVLTVQTKDRQLKMPQFSVMVAAACTVLEKAKDVSELRIVNFSGRYGFAFEKPSKNCTGVLEAPAGKLELRVAVWSHTLP
jgi:hypothetical protein